MEDGHVIVWKIGKNFPKKNLEVSLAATVNFGAHDPVATASVATAFADAFIAGNNSYVEVWMKNAFCQSLTFVSTQVSFKIPEYACSGLQVENVQTVPTSKFKYTTGLVALLLFLFYLSR